jgi:hypothetical protein
MTSVAVPMYTPPNDPTIVAKYNGWLHLHFNRPLTRLHVPNPAEFPAEFWGRMHKIVRAQF